MTLSLIKLYIQQKTGKYKFNKEHWNEKKHFLIFFIISITAILYGGEFLDPDPSKKIKKMRKPRKVYDTYYIRMGKKWKASYKKKLIKVYNRKGKLIVKHYYSTGIPQYREKVDYI